jgi:hypothetical protein
VAAWQRAVAEDPASEAGLKAQKKLQHVQQEQANVITHLQERLRH